MFLRYHNANGKSFAINPPRNVAARNYLAQQKFWARFNFDPSTIKAEKLRRFTSSTSLNAVVDVEKHEGIEEEIADRVRQVLCRNRVRVNAGLLSELVCELVDNFAQHSGHTLAVVAMQYYPNLRRIVFAVGDCGIGIRSSLASNPSYAYLTGHPHYDAILKAFEPLVSRTPEGGTGLTEVRDEVLNLNGRLTVTTGDGYVIISKGGTRYGQMMHELCGVQMELSFPEEV